MKLKIITIGSFLVTVGGLAMVLSIWTNSVVFEPTLPPILAMSVGSVMMVIGLLMS